MASLTKVALACVVALVAVLAAAVPGAAAADSKDGGNKISVQVFVEAFCPYSAEFVSRALWPALQADGVADLVDLKFAQCGHCRPDAAQDTGFECQHGAEECSANKMIACGVDEADEKGASAVANYAACMFSLPKGWMVDAGYNRQCAEGAGLDQDAIFTCGTTQDGTDKLMAHYKITEDAGVADHPATEKSSSSEQDDADATAAALAGEEVKKSKRNPVPWVIVDGSVLEDPFKVRKAICDAQKARGKTTPSGCEDPPPAALPEATSDSDDADAAADADDTDEAAKALADAAVAPVKKEKTKVEKKDDAKPAAGEAESAVATAAVPADEEKINDDVLKMIANEMATAAKEREEKDLDMQKKVAAKIEIYKAAKDADVEAKIAAFVDEGKPAGKKKDESSSKQKDEPAADAAADADASSSSSDDEAGGDTHAKAIAARKAARAAAVKAAKEKAALEDAAAAVAQDEAAAAKRKKDETSPASTSSESSMGSSYGSSKDKPSSEAAERIAARKEARREAAAEEKAAEEKAALERRREKNAAKRAAASAAAMGSRRQGGGLRAGNNKAAGGGASARVAARRKGAAAAAKAQGVFSNALEKTRMVEEERDGLVGGGGGGGSFGGRFANLGDSQFASLGEAMAAVPERSTEGPYGPFNYKLGKGLGSI